MAEDQGTAAAPLDLMVADVASHLESEPPGAYDGFALSNVLDGAPAGYRRRLLDAVASAASPGAVMVLRTLATGTPAEVAAALRDRALLWGVLQVTTVEIPDDRRLPPAPPPDPDGDPLPPPRRHGLRLPVDFCRRSTVTSWIRT